MWQSILTFLQSTGFAGFANSSMMVLGFIPGELIMIVVSCVLLYLGIAKKFEPLLLVPIAFGMLLSNLPLGGIFDAPTDSMSGGLVYYLYYGVKLGIYPPLIFMGVGAMTDFGPLIANPKSLLLGAAAQVGIFVPFVIAYYLGQWFPSLGFDLKAAASIGIIGGADGPTAIYLTSKLKPELLGPIAIAAYSYMALVPLIQPPIMMALTTKKERAIKMDQLREVTKVEKIIFPIAVTIFIGLILPAAVPLLGSLMLGNLFRETGLTNRLSDTAQNASSSRKR